MPSERGGAWTRLWTTVARHFVELVGFREEAREIGRKEMQPRVSPCASFRAFEARHPGASTVREYSSMGLLSIPLFSKWFLNVLRESKASEHLGSSLRNAVFCPEPTNKRAWEFVSNLRGRSFGQERWSNGALVFPRGRTSPSMNRPKMRGSHHFLGAIGLSVNKWFTRTL